MFDTLKMLAYKTKQFLCNHNYIKTRDNVFADYHLECSKCGKRSLIEPWLDYREEKA